MKIKQISLTVIIAVLYLGIVNAQIIPATQKMSLVGSDRAVINKHISEYTVFTMDKKNCK